MVNGAFFVPSGAGLSAQYAKASSVEPKAAVQIDQLTMYSGVFGDPRYGCSPFCPSYIKISDMLQLTLLTCLLNRPSERSFSSFC